jgi:outer membrane protein OmpA-like peptidoglycan-associated protein
MSVPRGESRAKGILVAAVIWIVILAALAAVTKFVVLPRFQDDLAKKTGSRGQYKNEIILAADSFSGYCIFRSEAMKKDLKAQGIKLTVRDDKADYTARMRALHDKKIHLAVFTFDPFLPAGARLCNFPATIIMVIDETKGADAIIAYEAAVPNLETLNDPQARFVLTPQSPSEFLARTVIAHFNLPLLPETWWEEANGAEEVYQKFTRADRGALRAYVLWEPWVSKALANPEAHLLLDSGKLKGYIVDVLVAERKFLHERPELVRAVVEAYLRASYSYSQSPEGMTRLVREDAAATGGEPLAADQAEQLVHGIQWKNTLENYAYFGLAGDSKQTGQHLEDIIANITEVLIKTDALSQDPLEGKANTIYYDQVLGQLQAANFHPAKKLNLIEGAGPDDLEPVRSEAPLRALSDEEWNNLRRVGEVRIEPISFARGTARINLQSQRDLAELARKLKSWPQYYILVTGHTRTEGDAEANRLLAEERARTAADYLVAAGIEPLRIKVRSQPATSAGQSVSFVLLQVPF